MVRQVCRELYQYLLSTGAKAMQDQGRLRSLTERGLRDRAAARARAGAAAADPGAEPALATLFIFFLSFLPVVLPFL